VRASLCRGVLPEVLPVRTPATLVDGLLQMAALYCMHHLEGAYLPTDMGAVWCSELALTDAPVDALVRCIETEDREQMCFDAEVVVEGECIIVLQGLTMSRIGGLDDVSSRTH
jgi:hypothetical protein